jgi:uncharacterized Tic20 family protein
MNQPYLGQKVSELRQLKGFTQEQLAEKCEVSTRTIQRIESGEVDPRAYTLQCLSEALAFDFGEQDTSRENIWLTILHLSSVLLILPIPLLLWSWKKNSSAKIDTQGRLVLNFQITMILLLSGAVILLMFTPLAMLGLDQSGLTQLEASPAFYIISSSLVLPLIAIGVYCTIEGVLNAMRSVANKSIRYPLSIPFLR